MSKWLASILRRFYGPVGTRHKVPQPLLSVETPAGRDLWRAVKDVVEMRDILVSSVW